MNMRIAGLMLSLLMATSTLAAVDLNTATQAELEAVKGIGPAKAQAIMTYRTKNGAFSSVDDLAKIKGFGKSTVNKLKSQFTVAGEKPEAAAAK
jgi:competence protein ComEA